MTARTTILKQRAEMADEKSNNDGDKKSNQGTSRKKNDKEKEKQRQAMEEKEKILNDAIERARALEEEIKEERRRAEAAVQAASESDKLRQQIADQLEESKKISLDPERLTPSIKELMKLQTDAIVSAIKIRPEHPIPDEGEASKTPKRPASPTTGTEPPGKKSYHEISPSSSMPEGEVYEIVEPDDDPGEGFSWDRMYDDETGSDTDRGAASDVTVSGPDTDTAISLDEDENEDTLDFNDPLEALVAMHDATDDKGKDKAKRELESMIDQEDLKRGPPCDPDLAKTVDDMINRGLNAEGKKKMDDYFPPKNLENVGVPYVNRELALKLYGKTKGIDKALKRYQRPLVRALVPVIRLVERLMKGKDKKSRGLALDTFRILAQANKNINKERRENVVKRFHSSYSLLTSKTKPTGKLLFGNDINAVLKECQTSKNIAGRLPLRSRGSDNRGRGGYGHGYNGRDNYRGGYRSRGNYQHDNSFLEDRGSRGRGAGQNRFQPRGNRGRGNRGFRGNRQPNQENKTQ